MKRSAFTMLEIIIVVVIGGILAAVMIPRLERDTTREAANQLVRHMQYAQHLAMVDDVYDDQDVTWFQKRWLTWFNNPEGYVVASLDLANGANTVTATDPGTQMLINSAQDGSGGDLRMFNLTSITLTGGCAGVIGTGDGPAISFDNFGKPYFFTNMADFSGATATDHALAAECTITIVGSNGKTATITIQPETGYIHLVNVI